MLINRLFLTNFRNIGKCELDVSAKQIILIGSNGQGKTNLLEAVYLLCYGSSFRTQNIKEAVNYHENFFYLSSDFEDADSMERMTEFSFDGQSKLIRIDGKQIKDRKDLIYTLPCIVFAHDDIEFVRGEPENRRRFFDQTMTMYDPVFFEDLRSYKNILRQRNAVIKAHRIELLDVYDEKIAELAQPIVKAREAVCKTFGEIFPVIYENVSQEGREINITYRPSWSSDMLKEDIIEKLKLQRETDLKMMTTTGGPHRDKFVLTDKNGLFASGASTGQMRLASLVFRSAQAEFYRRQTGKNPIFLVDDVLLELDSLKRGRYLENLGNFTQAFFTFLPDEKYFSKEGDDSSIIYHVTEGKFERKV